MSDSLNIPGPPKVLVLDKSGNAAGWESDLARRMSAAIRRQGVQVWGPFIPGDGEQISDLVARNSEANCLLVLVAGPKDLSGASKPTVSLDQSVARDSSPRLAAIYTCESVQALPKERVVGPEALAPIALISKPDMSPRDAALFFPEFFGELLTHCPDSISLAMVRFCFAKANRLAPNKVEVWTDS